MKQIALRTLAHHLGVSIDVDLLISGYRIDSRLIIPGDLFFAIKGAKVDGHFFLSEAKQQGALAAVVDRNYQGPNYGLILLAVDDVAKALQSLAQFSLALTLPFLVAVTGSVGKTTTKEFIATLLERKYTVAKTFGSYNSQLTLPLTILNRGEEKVLVLEMGMSQPGEMEKLVRIAPPDIAVLTKVALAHAEFFPGGIEEIAHEKMQIFSQLKTKIAIVPEKTSVPFSHLQTISFSQQDREADYFLSLADDRGHIDEKGVRACSFDLPFYEKHLLHNLLAAIAVARRMQLSWEEIEQQLPRIKVPKMRFEQLQYQGVSFINDAYNANPESMKAALSSLPLLKAGGKRIAVLASMKELGAFSEESHREIGLFAQRFVDHLLCFGKEARWIAETFSQAQKPAEYFMDKQELKRRLMELMLPGDVVLLKGSRSMQLEELLLSLEGT